MPSWITDENGLWHPAKEKANLVNHSNKDIVIYITDDTGKKFKKTIKPGEPYVYEGPDRAALFQWWEENGKPDAEKMKELDGNVTFGEDFRGNMEFLEFFAKMKNSLGFADMDAFLKYLGYDKEKYQKRFQEKASSISKHELPQKVEEIKTIGGGSVPHDPRQSKYGGFGTPAELTAAS